MRALTEDIRAEGCDRLFFYSGRIVGWEISDLQSHQAESFLKGDMLNFANNFIFLLWD